jgi:hypothetical protein
MGKLGTRACKRCGAWFTKHREAQAYCSERCRNADAQARKRIGKRSGDVLEVAMVVPRSGDTRPTDHPRQPSATLKPILYWEGGPLQGDDYPLEYDENGYPELPACLDRRKPKITRAAA